MVVMVTVMTIYGAKTSRWNSGCRWMISLFLVQSLVSKSTLCPKYTITNTNTNTAGRWLVPCEQDGALVQTLVLSPRQNFSTNGRPGFCRYHRQHRQHRPHHPHHQIEFIPTLEFHQRHNKPCFWLTHRLLPWAHSPIARWPPSASTSSSTAC